MSIASAKAYMARLTADQEFRRKINTIRDLGARTAYVKQAGFDWDLAEVKAVLAQMTDEELTAAGGGACRASSGVAACGRAWDRAALECSAVNGGGENCAR